MGNNQKHIPKVITTALNGYATDPIIYIQNRDTLSAGYGTDIIFEPNEVKALDKKTAEIILSGNVFKRIGS